MPGPWRETNGPYRRPRHAEPLPASGESRGPCLYEVVLRQAIATQHRLTRADHLDLRACEGCGKPYLLATVWLPHSEEGSIGCPRCGAEAVTWDGARGYVAYWQREAALARRPALSRAPVARSSRAAPPPAASPRAARS